MPTTPTSIIKRLMGTETFTDAIALAAGTTIGGVTQDSANRLVVTTASTLTVTAALHDGKTVTLNRVGGIACTLPAASGSGMILKFVLALVDTTGYTFAATPTTDTFSGSIGIGITNSTYKMFVAVAGGSNSNLITLNGTTTGGGSIGDTIILEDIASGIWAVRGNIIGSSTIASPFSHV